MEIETTGFAFGLIGTLVGAISVTVAVIRARNGKDQNGNGKVKALCRDISKVEGRTENQESRLRAVEIGRAGCLSRLDGIEEEQKRTTTAIQGLTTEVREIGNRVRP